MPTIITHLKPHIDEICAVWLLKRYLPNWRNAEIKFVHTDELVPPIIDNDERLHVGVGRGQFDEHKGDLGECAASLVYRHLNETVVLNANERKALDRLVEWVRLEDNGFHMSDKDREFSLPAVLEDHFLAKGKDSEAMFELGSVLMDALLIGMRNQVELAADWEKRVEFDSPFGPAVALTSEARAVDPKAYGEGFTLFVRRDKSGGYSEIRARADVTVDLTPVRDALQQADPEADWFFHHSKKLLINGGELPGQARLSGLDLKQLVELVKKAE